MSLRSFFLLGSLTHTWCDISLSRRQNVSHATLVPEFSDKFRINGCCFILSRCNAFLHVFCSFYTLLCSLWLLRQKTLRVFPFGLVVVALFYNITTNSFNKKKSRILHIRLCFMRQKNILKMQTKFYNIFCFIFHIILIHFADSAQLMIMKFLKFYFSLRLTTKQLCLEYFGTVSLCRS